VLDEVPLHRLGLGPGLPDRLPEGNGLQNEGDGQHGAPDGEVASWLRADEFLDAVRGRHRGAGHKQPQRGEQ